MEKRSPATARLKLRDTQPPVETVSSTSPKRLNYFERYLTIWVAVCMAIGILLGRSLPEVADSLRRMDFAAGSKSTYRSRY
jgi:ACR3 family arsenite transporter